MWTLLLGAALAADTVAIDPSDWLVLGPVDAPAPAFSDEGAAGRITHVGLELEAAWPVAGDAIRWVDGQALTWVPMRGRPTLAADGVKVAWLATTLRADRYVEAQLTLPLTHPASVWLDGVQVLTSGGAEKKEASKEPPEATLKLTPGDHLLVVHTAYDPDRKGPWRVGPRLELPAARAPYLHTERRDTRHLDIADLLDTPAVGSVDLSPDGAHAMVSWRRPEVPADDAERWTEIRRTRDGAVVVLLAGGESRVSWLPDGRYGFVTPAGEASTLWVADLSGGARRVLEGIEHLAGVWWTADPERVVLGITEEDETDDGGLKRLRGTHDRQGGDRDRTHLWVASTSTGAMRRLTGGPRSAWVHDVHPTAPRMLVSLEDRDTADHPYTRQTVYTLDLLTGVAEPFLVDVTHLNTIRWAPDGARMLLTGGPSFLDGLGSVLGDDALPNDYDGQLYLRDAAGTITAVSKEFDPSIGEAVWDRDGDIVLSAITGDRNLLYRFGTGDGSFTELGAPPAWVEGFSVARSADAMLAVGSSADATPAVYATEGQRWSSWLAPGAERFARLDLGQVEPFTFTSSKGRAIAGHVIRPPDFDPSRRYPVIVNYYGGTSPIGQAFGGRYPAALWAARGYLVYVLQPSGAVGFGQEFSALHVGTWGRDGVDEIIEGTQAFLAAHPQADPDRVGCIGASYGGFMTMLLVTHTDMFRAAVSHAGISSISSYWGEGWWGHTYSAIASGRSLPWNDRALYVEQSPLFRADRISTPLLLLHGMGDTNVPPGESDSMYTALRVLGREVEYIQIDGQGHWVLDHPKRVKWMATILAWFDRELRDDPAWWEALHGPVDGPE